MLVLDRRGRRRIVDLIETPRGQTLLRERTLPSREHFLGIVLPSGVVDLVQDVEELVEVGALQRAGDEMLQRIAHRTGLRMARIEEHENEIRYIDDLVRDPQRRRALLVRIEPG